MICCVDLHPNLFTRTILLLFSTTTHILLVTFVYYLLTMAGFFVQTMYGHVFSFRAASQNSYRWEMDPPPTDRSHTEALYLLKKSPLFIFVFLVVSLYLPSSAGLAPVPGLLHWKSASNWKRFHCVFLAISALLAWTIGLAFPAQTSHVRICRKITIRPLQEKPVI